MVKKRDLLAQVRTIARAAGFDLEFVREGSNHEVWRIGSQRIVIPRHREINENTARGIINKARKAGQRGS